MNLNLEMLMIPVVLKYHNDLHVKELKPWNVNDSSSPQVSQWLTR